MTVVDRLDGINSGLGRKAPCLVATTDDIILSGLQTLDGVLVAEGSRVLVWKQSNPIDNGIYNASTGNWQRAADFDGPRDAVGGTSVFVKSGTLNGACEYFVAGSDAITIGQSEIIFEVAKSIAPGSSVIATKSLTEMGAKPSMNAAEITALNAEILSAFNSGIRRFDGLDKTYALTGNTGLIIPPGAEFFGARIDLSGVSANHKGLTAAGTLSTASALTADTDVGEYIVQVASTSAYTEGQPVFIKRDALFHSFATAPIGEMNRVRKIIDGTTLWLYYPVTFDFPVSDNATIAPFVTSRDETIFRDMEIIGADTYGHNQYGLYFQNLDGAVVERVSIYGVDQVNCDFNRCIHPRGTRNSFRRSRGLFGYGYLHENGTRDAQISGGDAGHMRHGSVTGSGSPGGIQIDISVDGLHCSNMSDSGVDFHGTTIGCYASRVIVEGDAGQRNAESTPDVSDGIISEGVNSRFVDCVVKNVDGAGMKIQPLSDLHTFFGGGYGIIKGGYAENCAGEAAVIYMANSGVTLDKGQILDVVSRGCDSNAASAAVRVYVASGCALNDCLIRCPRVDYSGASGLQVRATNGGAIGRAMIADPGITDSGQLDLYCLIDGGSIGEIMVHGGRLDDAGSATGQLYILASLAGTVDSIDIEGISLRNAARGLYLRATGSGSSIGSAIVNRVRTRNHTSENIYAQADGSGTFGSLALNGNNTDGGTYGLRTSGVALVTTDGKNVLGTHSTSKRAFASATTLDLGKDIGIVTAATIIIASGVATVTQPAHSGHLLLKIDTEASAATDDLDTLTITGIRDQQVVTLRSLANARDVVVKDGTGNLRIAGDFTLSHSQDTITLIYHEGDGFFTEISRSDNEA